MSEWMAVARVDEVPPERVAVFNIGDHDVAVCNVDGALYAIDDLCTHDGGPLDQGYLEGCEIECPRHGARFDVRTGAVTQLPAFEKLETHPVRVQGDTIEIGIDHAL
jgi:3-phenylpropionate/trans-cinnamate dioxygenase ferredoxin subunit